ncbi:MAG: hemolysin family protein [Leptospira sp.]|nr:hemolysin family protein [Leptospira sp.]
MKLQSIRYKKGFVTVFRFFVAAEFSLVSLRPSRLEELLKDGKPLALITKKATEKLNDMLSVCQVGITLASLLLGWLGEKVLAHRLELYFNNVELYPNQSTVHGIAFTVSFIIVTFLHVTLGEQVPKTIAIQNTEMVALRSSIPLFFFYFLFYPITFILSRVTGGIIRLFRLKMLKEKYVHSADELLILIGEHSRQGNVDSAELQIIQKTIEFSEHEAKEVMTHRLSIVGIPANLEVEKILPLIAEHNFSRYPVYENTTDKIIGVVHVQSFLEWMANPLRNKADKITILMQKPIFVPETLSIEKVLQKLRLTKQHMAIVVDEYGGVAGILTLEDIIEEIFGQIRDETDENEVDPLPKDSSTSFIIDGEAELDDLKEILEGENLEEVEDVRTLAGFIIDKHGDMPKEGSSIKIAKGNLTVEKMDGNKIKTIRFVRTLEEVTGGEDNKKNA